MISNEVLEMLKAKGGQLARLAKNYEAARSTAHKQVIENAIRQNMPPAAWLAQYKSEAKAK